MRSSHVQRLFDAAALGDPRGVCAALDIGVPVNARNGRGQTALVVAAQAGRSDVVGVLLQSGARIDVKTDPLFGLIEPTHAADLPGSSSMPAVSQAEVGGTSRIHSVPAGASKTDRAPAEDVPGLDLSNHTDDLLSEAGPLLTASVCGHVEVVDLLLRAGADPNAVDWSETPPLVGAAAQGHLRVIDRLLTAGARVDAGTGLTALEEAVVNGHADVVRRLLRADADVDRRNEDGGTVLMLAAATGCLPIVRLLVEAGADVNATTDGEAALSCAASYGQLSVYAYLLPKSDPSVQARGDVALMAYLEYVARM